MKMLTNSTPTALWFDIIHEAEANCSIQLDVEIESYLVFLLTRYVDKPELIKRVIATEFLEGLNLGRHQRDSALQNVGDTCLLLSGLFPGLAAKRLVKVSYFIYMGQSAYSHVSQTSNDLFSLLTQQFVMLMEVLQSTRQYSRDVPDLLPLEAYELWQDVGSKRALKVLQGQSGFGSVPVIKIK